MASSHPQFLIRPFRFGTTDMSDISTISALGNEHDELTIYMTRNIQQKWTSYRNGCCRFLKTLVLGPGSVCYVAEDATTKIVVGWAIWSRHGKSLKAREWQRPNSGVFMAIERKLNEIEIGYYKYIPNTDPTAHHAHKKILMPVLGEEWPADIFTEYWELDGLYVHPSYYRKGIGKMLAEWGVERGKEERVPVLVHSSPLGRKLYESVGFAVMKRMSGFDRWIPEFEEGGEEKGCWTMGWQYEGGDEVERCRRKFAEEREQGKEEMRGAQLVVPAEAISVT